MTTISGHLLNRFASDVYSQDGADGVIAHILETIGDNDGWCVEFGAWDGVYCSNCANLIRNKNYSGVFIEANKKKFAQLQDNYREFANVTSLNNFVGFGSSDNLDALLRDVPIPANFDFLSIDIDGNDYHVWHAISRYQPKVVCVEFNPTIPNEVDFVQPADPLVQQGCSAAALVRLGANKGYELVCCTQWNAFFVERQYFDKFAIRDNSLHELHRDRSFITYMFIGYDGRVLLTGYKYLRWHQMPIDERRVQQLPFALFGHQDDYSSLKRLLFKTYRRWRTRRR